MKKLFMLLTAVLLTASLSGCVWWGPWGGPGGGHGGGHGGGGGFHHGGPGR